MARKRAHPPKIARKFMPDLIRKDIYTEYDIYIKNHSIKNFKNYVLKKVKLELNLSIQTQNITLN